MGKENTKLKSETIKTKSKMEYTQSQVERAKRAYSAMLNYRTVESYEPQYIGWAAAEQRCEYHNKIVREILSGNMELQREWKLFFLNQEKKADDKRNESKSKLAKNKSASQEVLDFVKKSGRLLGDYYEFIKGNKQYAREFFSKKFSMESAQQFITINN